MSKAKPTMNKKAELTKVYPCTIITDRYGGTYSGGQWTAFNLDFWCMPYPIGQDDISCAKFWHGVEHKKYIIGKGDSPQKAYEDLAKKLI